MSNNIEFVDVIDLDASMRAADVDKFLDEHESDLPEDCFLFEMAKQSRVALRKGNIDEMVPIDEFQWCGTSSGFTYEFLVKYVCPKIKGRVEVVFNWEGGERSGFICVDGVVHECDVEIVLKPR